MREWVDASLARILPESGESPGRVLEIGCGTGLLAWRLAPVADHYVGLDLSPATVAALAAALADRPWSAEFHCRPADDLSWLPAAGFDVVVLNSVVQYFPDVRYLDEVLTVAARLVAPGGRIIVGDVRALPLARMFHAAVATFRTPVLVNNVGRLADRVDRARAEDTELLLAPAYFDRIAGALGRSVEVEVSPRRGWLLNEMSMYRCDAVLTFDAEPPAAGIEWIDFAELRCTADELAALVARRAVPLGVRGVPNSRVIEDSRLLAVLDSGDPAATGLGEDEAIDPEDLWSLELPGWQVRLSWLDTDERSRYDVVFWPEEAGPVRVDWPRAAEDGPLASDPLRPRLARALVDQVRALLAERLPEHMVPAALVVVDRIPRTESGKLDQRALPSPDGRVHWPIADYAAPCTTTETILASFWSELLGVSPIGRDDDFFAAGGHSLLAIELVSRLRETFLIELPLRAMFETKKLAKLAEVIDRVRGEQDGPVLPPIGRAEGDRLPLSFGQERMWFLSQLVRGNAFYNVPLAYRLVGDLDVAALRAAFRCLVDRHDALRTRFVVPEDEPSGQPYQVIDPTGVELAAVDLSTVDESGREERARELAEQEAARPFELDRGPLVRGTLVRLSPAEHVLLVTMHHSAADGWSLGVLMRELSEWYAAAIERRPVRLPELPVRYADFAVWQRDWLRGEVLDRQLTYWRDRLAGMPEALVLPSAWPRPAVMSYRGTRLFFEVPAHTAVALRRLANDNQVTLFMVLLAAYHALLARYSATEDVAVGVPIAGRIQPEVEHLIGFFVNTLVMRTDCAGDPAFTELLGRERETALGAFAHQDLPFEQLVQSLAPARDLSRNPLVQVYFQLQQQGGGDLYLPGVAAAQFERALATTRHDLELHMVEADGDLRGQLVFNIDLFDPPSARRLLDQFTALLDRVAEDPTRPLSALMALTKEEQRRIATLAELPVARLGTSQRDRARTYVEPATATGRRLAELWAEVLAVPRVGAEDNFFDLGGNSLKATQLLVRILVEFDVELEVQQFFLAGTLAELAELVDATPAAAGPAVPELARLPRSGTA